MAFLLFCVKNFKLYKMFLIFIKVQKENFMKINKKIQFFGRLIAAIVILGITAFFTPGFALSNLWTLIVGVLALTIIDFAIGSFTKLFYHPYYKMFIGFCLSG